MSKIFLLICMCIVFQICADSIAPLSYRDTLPVGGSVTINKTLFITKEPPTTAKIDVFFLTDATGSMSSFLDTVRAYASDIIDSTSILGDVAYGVGSYRNRTGQGSSNPYIFQMETNLSTNDALVKTALNSWVTGGGDGEEDAFYAMKTIADSATWRTGSTRILIWFGDIGSKDPSEGVYETDVVNALIDKNIIVEAMNIKTYNLGLDHKGQAQRIADTTNGHYYPNPAIDSIVTLIKDAIVEVFFEYKKVHLEAYNIGSDISVTFSPSSYDSSYDRSVDRQFDFTATITKNTNSLTNAFTISGLVDSGIVATEYDTIDLAGLHEWPDIVSSSIYDKNGDGVGDSILIVLDSVVPDKYTLTGAQFPWGPHSFNPTLTNANLNATKDTVTFSFANSNPYHTLGKEILQLTMDSLTIASTHSGDLFDKIGPICIDTAILYERFLPGPDTLLVKVSEPVDISLLVGTEFILRKGGVEHLLTLIAPATNPDGASTDVYFICSDLGVNAPAAGDSLRVNPAGAMVDLEGNAVHMDNIAVPIKLQRQTISPVASATLYDSDANGHGDSLLITFSTVLNPALFSECVLEYPKGSGDIVTLPVSAMSTISPTEYAVTGFSMANLATSGLGDLTVKFDSLGTPVERLADVQDGIAPVVIAASLVDSIKTGAADILTVTYSEEIQPVTATVPSQMKALATLTPYSADLSVLSHVGAVVQYSVNSLTGVTKIVNGDSLQCNAAAIPPITDLVSNLQINSNNRFCVIAVTTVGTLSYKLLDGSNLFIDTVLTNSHATIEVVYSAASLTAGPDSIACVLTSADGDSEIIVLVEDAAQQGIYTAALAIGYNAAFTAANSILEGVYLDPYTADTTASSGSVEFMGSTVTAPLTLLHDAHIYDEASLVYVHNVPADVKVSLLTHLDRQCKIYLNTYSKTTLTSFDVIVTSAVHKDSEVVNLLLTDAIAGNSDTLRLIMAKIMPHSCNDIVAPTALNGILETTSQDTLFLEWTNPLDPTDQAFDTVLVQGEIGVVGVDSALISDENEDGRADLIRVHYSVPTPMDFTVKGAYWNCVAPLNMRAPDALTKVSATEYTYAFTTTSFGVDLTGVPAGTLPESLPRMIFNAGQEYPVIDSIDLQDRVGIVPTAATLFEAEVGTGKPDTLQVFFSEQILATGPAMGSLTRLAVAGGDDTLIYSTSLPVALETGSAIALAADGMSATILTPHQPRDYYLDKRLFLDTTLAYDLLRNRASRKSVPITHRGALFFTKVGDPVPVGSFKSEENSAITAHLYGRSITAGIDNALLTITSLDGESETFTMVESSTVPGYYTANVAISYVPALAVGNVNVEGVIVSPVENDTTAFVSSAELGDRTYAGAFDLTYRGKKNLFVKNSLKAVTKSVTHLDTTLYVCFNSDLTELQPSYTVRVESAVHGDVEEIVLESVLNGDPDFTHTERFQLAKGVKHYCSSILKPTSANGIIETSAEDTLFLQWVNPLIPTEILTDTIVVTGVEQSVNVSSAKVYDRDENGVLDVVSVIFHAPLPMLFTADHVLWPTADVAGAITIDSAVQVGTHQIDYYVTGTAGQLDVTAIPVGLLPAQRPVINFTAGQSYPVVASAPIQDGMGMVPVKAMVKASGYYSLEPDTLTTWLSEALHPSITGALPPLRKVVSGVDHLTLYATSLTMPYVPGNMTTISPDRTMMTQLVAKSDVSQYRNHHIFVDTLSGADVVGNRSARKGVPLDFAGALYFSEQTTGTIANSFNVQSSATLLAHLQTVSPTALVDTLLITLASVEGESETLALVETAPLSGDFNAVLPVAYGTALTALNGIVEAVYDNFFSNDTTIYTASVPVNGGIRTEQLTITYTGQNDLFAKNKQLIRTRLFTDADSLFYTCFNSDSKNVLPEYTIAIRTADHGDQEVVVLNATTDIDASNLNVERLQLIKGLPFISSDVRRPVASNGVIETSAIDTVFLSWSHPLNPAITCADTILVQGTPIIFAPLKATILDTNENGLVDALIMEYNNPIPEAFVLQELYWNSQSVLPVAPLATELITGTSCKVTFAERIDLLNITGVNHLAGPTLAPVVNLAAQDFFNFSALQSVITDGVGAVPVDAKVLRSHRGTVEPDTLLVKVSEPISAVAKSNLVRTCLPAQVLDPLSPISGYETSLELATLSPVAELCNPLDSTVTLLVSKDNPQLVRGNSLFLNQTSGYVDAAAVAPARKRIGIKSYEKLFFSYPEVPDSALQFAQWPNHTTVLMTLQGESSTALVEQMTVILTTEFGDTETVILTETGPLTGCFVGQIAYTFTTAVFPESGLIEGVYTDIDVNCINTITCNAVTPDGIASVSLLPLHYNAPPRVISAHYFAASIDTDLPDTLVVTSNVPVTWPTAVLPTVSEIFDYWNGLSSVSDITVASVMDQNTVGTLTQARILIPREMALTPELDSIRFYPNSIQIQTAEAVHPQLSFYVPIIFGSRPEISIDIVPNPFVPELSLVPELFRSYIPNAPVHGCGIRVRSRVKIARVNYTILDAVNNVVVENQVLYGDPSMNRYYGAWTGENRIGRAVGKATYVVLFVVEDITGEIYKAEKLVGVKQPYIPRSMPWD